MNFLTLSYPFGFSLYFCIINDIVISVSYTRMWIIPHVLVLFYILALCEIDEFYNRDNPEGVCAVVQDEVAVHGYRQRSMGRGGAGIRRRRSRVTANRTDEYFQSRKGESNTAEIVQLVTWR